MTVLLGLKKGNNRRLIYKNYFKRFFDFWIALIALTCISPILLVVTIWLYFANRAQGHFSFRSDLAKEEKYSR